MTRRQVLLCAVLAAVLVSGLAVGALSQTTTRAVAFEGLPDAGSATRWGLPIARSLRDLSAVMTIGLLGFVTILLPYEERIRKRLRAPAVRAVRAAGWSATLWFAAGLLVVVFTYSDLAGVPVSADGFVEGLGSFVVEVGIGQSLATSAVMSGLVAAGCLLWPRGDGAIALALLALAALWPLALTGHAADAESHGQAVLLLFAHLVAVTTWVGGLAAFGLLQDDLGRHREQVLRRYSTTAAACFAVVALSGVLSAFLRLGGWRDLTTPYGTLIILKATALAMLGIAGHFQRRHLFGKAPTWTTESRRSFARLAATELVIMALAIGLGVALARTAPPQPGAAAGIAGEGASAATASVNCYADGGDGGATAGGDGLRRKT